jgi:hypothetical protein
MAAADTATFEAAGLDMATFTAFFKIAEVAETEADS